MEVRVFLWFGFIWFIENTVASSPKGLLVTNSEENKCTTELNTCSIQMGDMVSSGPRGESGPGGPQGLQGPQGPQGPQGQLGPTGPMGSFGVPGEPGQKGLDGTPGSKGDKGDEGFKGLKGELGEKGEKGEKGQPGQKGETGVGLPGTDGSVFCPQEDYGGSDVGEPVPENIETCNYQNKGFKTGTYKIKTPSFEVICDMEKNRTCIPLRDRANSSVIDSESFTHRKTPFWASEIGLDLSKLYGVTENQLEWLISGSSFTSLEITYHCKNSYILHKEKGVDGDLRLMSWKEAVIGPRPSEDSPYFYVVSTENDGCKDSGDHKTEWRQSTIQMNSRLKVLPVTDFYIRDIREGEDQKFYLELKELCFNF